MKTSTFLAIATGLTASFVSAQLDSIPPCALQCALQSLGQTGCPQTDIACICKSTSFIQGLLPCVQTSCNTPQLLQDTVEAAAELCLLAGVTLTVQLPTATETSTAPPSTTETVTATDVSTTVTDTTATETSTSVSTSETTVVPSPSGNNTSPTSTNPPAPTGTDDSGAARNAIAFGGVALAMIAALL